MYRRPIQCSPLRRSLTPAGGTTGRSSATDGLDIVGVDVLDLVGLEVEVFEDGVAAGAGLRAELHGADELRGRQADLLRQDGQSVPAQYLGHVARFLVGSAQVHREGRAQAALLAMGGGALGVEQVERVVDLVVGAGRGP